MRRVTRLSAALSAAGILLTHVGCGAREGGNRSSGGPPSATAPFASSGPAPGVRFEDATTQAGLTFRHVNGASGRKYMLETLGSGVCVFDYDGDGLQDIFFVQSGLLPGATSPSPPRPSLYRNLGGRFRDVT